MSFPLCRWCKKPLHLHSRVGDTDEPYTTHCECTALREQLAAASAKLEKVMARPSVSLSTYEAVETERDTLREIVRRLVEWDNADLSGRAMQAGRTFEQIIADARKVLN